MLGNPNTPQGERSLEDTERERENEKEGTGGGQERSCQRKWSLRNQAWANTGGARWLLQFCFTSPCWGKFSPSFSRRRKEESWPSWSKRWPLKAALGDKLQNWGETACPLPSLPFCVSALPEIMPRWVYTRSRCPCAHRALLFNQTLCSA